MEKLPKPPGYFPWDPRSAWAKLFKQDISPLWLEKHQAALNTNAVMIIYEGTPTTSEELIAQGLTIIPEQQGWVRINQHSYPCYECSAPSTLTLPLMYYPWVNSPLPQIITLMATAPRGPKDVTNLLSKTPLEYGEQILVQNRSRTVQWIPGVEISQDVLFMEHLKEPHYLYRNIKPIPYDYDYCKKNDCQGAL